jgi:polyisoprenyl-phosphate glycosyltransferase
VASIRFHDQRERARALVSLGLECIHAQRARQFERWILRTMKPDYSFVIPILDECETLDELYGRLEPVMAALDGPSEVVLVDDGSTDGSYDVMRKLHERDPRVKALRLSRNFGHQTALSAGLDHAQGRAVIIMDGDLQDPPEVALRLAERWREGYDVVYAVRDHRAGESRRKVATARWFYRLLRRLSEVDIPADVGDFRLVDRRAVEAVKRMPEHRRYLRGMFAWVGYSQTGVPYERVARPRGETKFTMRKMLAFAADGIVSFSAVPLRLALNVGFLVSAATFVLGFLAIVLKLTDVYAAPGWASIVVAIAFLGGMQLTVLGVIGEYIARIHEEVKQRPLYLLRDQVGIPADDLSGTSSRAEEEFVVRERADSAPPQA